MRPPVILGITALSVLVAIAACQGKGQNQTDIFTVQKGTVTLAVDVPPEKAGDITSVEFSVDDKPLATDTAGPEWSVQFKTTDVPDGVHYVKAVGNPGAGDIVLLENSIMIQNGTGGAAPAAQASTAAP